jgi:Do/DeqQ family serine protease
VLSDQDEQVMTGFFLSGSRSMAELVLRFLAAVLCVQAGLALTPAAAAAGERVVPKTRGEMTASFAPVVKAATPAVVNVYVRHRVQVQRPRLFEDPFFRRFFGRELGLPNTRVQNSLGSGVIVSPDGVVVTNYHVIKGKGETNIKVALSDHREFEAKVMLKDEKADLAVLRLEGGSGVFPYLTFADSDATEVGDLVLAIGDPFGVGQTVTSGIVSALAGTRVGVSDYQFFIQTDAAINPGNSGGALVDMNGHLLGINTAIYSTSGGSLGIGFAIPANMVRVVVDAALHGGKVNRPWLGAELQSVTSEIVEAMGLDRPQGALVASVSPDGPAARAGVKRGDVVLSVDGHEASNAQAAQYYFTRKGVSGQVAVEVLRNGRKLAFNIALQAPPEIPPRNQQTLQDGDNPFAGATVANLSPAVAEELSLNVTKGVVIIETVANSVARELGWRPGDIILEVNGQSVDSVRTLRRLADKGARSWRLRYMRGGRPFEIFLR